MEGSDSQEGRSRFVDREFTNLAVYKYEKVKDDITAAEALYQRVLAINDADYDFYKNDKEGLQAIYADQSDVTGLDLYSDIVDLIASSKKSEEAYLGTGDGGLLAALNARYAALGKVFQTEALTTAKDAAANAYNKWAKSSLVDDHTALLEAMDALDQALTTQETAKTECEKANSDLVAELATVYGNDDSYYIKTLEAIKTKYADDNARYDDLKSELLTTLSALVTGDGSAYQTVKAKIKDAADIKIL